MFTRYRIYMVTVYLFIIISSTARSKPAKARRSSDVGYAWGTIRCGYKLASFPGSSLAAMGNHLTESSLPNHYGHQWKTTVYSHLWWALFILIVLLYILYSVCSKCINIEWKKLCKDAPVSFVSRVRQLWSYWCLSMGCWDVIVWFISDRGKEQSRYTHGIIDYKLKPPFK